MTFREPAEEEANCEGHGPVAYHEGSREAVNHTTILRAGGWFALLLGLGIVHPGQAQSPYRPLPSGGAPVTYSRNPLVRLPVQLDDKARAAIRELRLYVKTPGTEWVFAVSGPATQTSFDYRAVKDGEYSFLFVTVDKTGRTNPPTLEGRAPHQVIVVDTLAPELGVQLVPVGNRERHLKAQIRDANPDWASVKMEYLEGTQWKSMQPLGTDSPGVFRIPNPSILGGKIRVSAQDKAGNTASKVIDLGDPVQSISLAPQTKPEPGILPGNLNKDPLAVNIPGSNPVIEPADLKLPGMDDLKKDLPPLVDPSKADPMKLVEVSSPLDSSSMKIPTIPDGPGGDSLLKLPTQSTGEQQKPKYVDPYSPPSLNPYAPAPTEEVRKPVQGNPMSSGGGEMTPPASSKHVILNALRCSLDYAVETTPFAGPPRVEFWATRDNGRSWQRLVDESPGRSPAKLLLPGEGYFGIKARTNGNGQPPTQGDSPDALVEVDVTKPVVNLLPVTLGSGNDTGTLTIQWTAQDKNLLYNSINLQYKVKADGPWIPIANSIKNEGSFRWAVPQGVGSEIYIRIEASDRAGNIGRAEMSEPLVLPQPKVTVLGVGPVR